MMLAGTAPLRVAVIGAGAFGGWTALYLARSGADVTLVDAWGPGNARASSGGETRIIRSVYGSSRLNVELSARALALWREWDRRSGLQYYRRTGVLWMTGADDSYVRDSLPLLRECDLPYEELDVAAAATRWPQIHFDGVRGACFEREAGYLLARLACQAVAREAVEIGGKYRQAAVAAVADSGGRADVRLADGSRLVADRYVFACGPWLGRLFPDLVGPLLRITRQEVYYLGTPAGDDRFVDPRLTVWADLSDRFIYGIPGNLHRGFKIADDDRGPEFDPTSGDRRPTVEGERHLRDFVGRRFPALSSAPAIGAEVCQYENSPDGQFIIDRHPELADVWIAGGGSGHGFKMGPAIGERIARHIVTDAPVDADFALARFARP